MFRNPFLGKGFGVGQETLSTSVEGEVKRSKSEKTVFICHIWGWITKWKRMVL